ncbi:hypothetical protein [Hymenobacter sp. YC55]|uniref:hypothetical protein n=1 Tax=Hymenobacter sp. YC55 TaxID=3034019 RepID=UPI0023F858CE|nr:hypothetical protein [Hymenobacter sp. YC55]MDF7813913.1 hypothetical protein [Hymenobacter sp. YC55]
MKSCFLCEPGWDDPTWPTPAKGKFLTTAFIIRLLLLFLGWAAPNRGFAQVALPASPLAQVQALHLPAALDQPVAVYYVPGYETRALALRHLMQEVKTFYQQQLQLDVPFSLAVLDSARWTSIYSEQGRPFYGVPWVSKKPYVAFLPATGGRINEQLAAVEEKRRANPKKPVDSRRFAYGGTKLGVPDLIGIHELGHAYTDAYGINLQVAWLRELVATYFCYAYLRQQLPPQAAGWEAANHLFYRNVKPTYTSLADFDRLYFGVGPDNYGWYQAYFQQQVEHVYREQGLGFLRALPHAFPMSEPPVTDGEEALTRVEKICPGFRAWAAAGKGAAPQTGKN